MEFLIHGDTHGSFQYLLEDLQLLYGDKDPKDLGIIILGDAGLNFYLNKTDEKKKVMLNNRGYTFYLVRGNHEARPQDLPNIQMIYDTEIKGDIYIEEEYPNIRYLIDGETYYFGDYKCLCLGGAFSVDKEYRLLNKYQWFYNEQLTEEEMAEIEANIQCGDFDFVFSHTCPYSWMPRDLFLPFIDQSKVDNSMEKWMEHIKDTFDWNIWCFGHYHDDRLVRRGVEMFFHRLSSLNEIYNRWGYFGKYGKLPKDLNMPCDPNFFDNP